MAAAVPPPLAYAVRAPWEFKNPHDLETVNVRVRRTALKALAGVSALFAAGGAYSMLAFGASPLMGTYAAVALTGLVLFGISTYVCSQMVDYTNPQELAEFRAEVARSPLSKMGDRHGLWRVLGYALSPEEFMGRMQGDPHYHSLDALIQLKRDLQREFAAHGMQSQDYAPCVIQVGQEYFRRALSHQPGHTILERYSITDLREFELLSPGQVRLYERYVPHLEKLRRQRGQFQRDCHAVLTAAQEDHERNTEFQRADLQRQKRGLEEALMRTSDPETQRALRETLSGVERTLLTLEYPPQFDTLRTKATGIEREKRAEAYRAFVAATADLDATWAACRWW